MGIIASIALMPVCSGSLTLSRCTIPGAFTSTFWVSLEAMGPFPSTGWPSAFTTRPTIAGPTGTSAMRPVRLTTSPSRISWPSPIRATPTLSSSRFSTRPISSWGNSTSSPAITPERPYTRAMPSPVDSTVPVSLTSICLPYVLICSRRMRLISSALICISPSLPSA